MVAGFCPISNLSFIGRAEVYRLSLEPACPKKEYRSEGLTERQALDLGRIAREDKRLYRACLLKERLRDVFKATGTAAAAELLDSWLRSASRSRAREIKELSKKARRHRDAIVRAVGLGLSNARAQAVSNKIKLTVRMGYGFRNVDNLIALVMLRCSNLPIELRGAYRPTQTGEASLFCCKTWGISPSQGGGRPQGVSWKYRHNQRLFRVAYQRESSLAEHRECDLAAAFS